MNVCIQQSTVAKCIYLAVHQYLVTCNCFHLFILLRKLAAFCYVISASFQINFRYFFFLLNVAACTRVTWNNYRSNGDNICAIVGLCQTAYWLLFLFSFYFSIRFCFFFIRFRRILWNMCQVERIKEIPLCLVLNNSIGNAIFNYWSYLLDHIGLWINKILNKNWQFGYVDNKAIAWNDNKGALISIEHPSECHLITVPHIILCVWKK